MYPKVDLEILGQRKADLMDRIRSRRADVEVDFDAVMRPVLWAENAYAKWKEISPFVKFAALPLGFLLKRKVFPQSGGIISGLFRWAPLAVNVFKAMR